MKRNYKQERIAKVHMWHSDLPLNGGPVKAACGKEIKHPEPVYFVDYANCDIAYSLSGICRSCANKAERKRYVYGLSEAQEAMIERSLHA